jgi:succinoglycan biosynthesis protein ExoA
MNLVTVILPLRNEAAFIRPVLASLLTQDYPSDYLEILIADGLSTDGTPAIVSEMASQHPHIRLQVLQNPGCIVPTGLNLALRLARGEIIIRLDGHTLLAPNYISQCVKALQCTGADNVGGRMNAVGATPFGRAVALATSTPFGIGGGRFHYSQHEEWVDTVYMGAWPRHVFKKIGLFDEELVRDQDDEFNYRLREQGGRILLSPSIHSEYAVRSTPRALWSQYFQYGYWKIRVLQKHPRQMSLRQFVPPLFVLSLIVSVLLLPIPFSSFALHPSSWIPILYLLANLTVSIYTSYRRGWSALPLLPLVFAILHISYGLGFLVGLFKFANRWGDKVGKIPPFRPISG